MSDEENAGAAYLAALKKSTPQAAAAAPARAPILPSSNLNNGIGAPANTISPVGENEKAQDTAAREAHACAKSSLAYRPGRPSRISVCTDATWKPWQRSGWAQNSG